MSPLCKTSVCETWPLIETSPKHSGMSNRIVGSGHPAKPHRTTTPASVTFTWSHAGHPVVTCISHMQKIRPRTGTKSRGL